MVQPPEQTPKKKKTMTDPSGASRCIQHGDHCECTLLARTLNIDPAAISFSFCQRVLQKHWRMTCRHGSQGETPRLVPAVERWRELGEVDAVKAILISNDPSQD